MDSQIIFVQLSVIVVIAAIISLIMRLLRQPLIMGYILTGLILAQGPIDITHSRDLLDTFSNIGVTLLLFIIGLGLNISVFRRLGKPVFLTALTVLLTLGSAGFLIMSTLGFGVSTAVLIGLSLFFSSTIIIAKVLSDKKEITRLHGQLAIGVILLDDVVATIALLFVAVGHGGFGLQEIGLLLGKGVVSALVLFFVSAKLLPRLTKWFASSQELLFLFAIAWGFGIATLAQLVGFSIEVGALFAGVSLASLPYSQEISSRLKPLRDFFVVLFFISLGASLNVHNLLAQMWPALVLSIVVIVLKPLSVMLSLGLLGYTRRTSFKTAINLSQISEFSIILIVLAAHSGIINESVSAMITIVALVTIASSTYLMQYDDKIFSKLEHHLRFFERKVVRSETKTVSSYPLILFGYHKGGHEFVKTFREMHKRFVVVDYNPEVIETLERQRIHYMYGDATDFELLDEIGLARAKLIVSIITDFATNRTLAKHVRQVNSQAVFVCHADNYEQAAELYKLEVTYVMMPHFIGSEQISHFIKKNGTSLEAFEKYRSKHLIDLGHTALR